MHLLIMGAPGTGKGTNAKNIAKYYSVPHISTGDIFRHEMANNTELGILAASYIDKGQLVPDDITIEIARERLSEKDCEKGFLLDGFPRTIQQAYALDDILKSLNREIDVVINLTVDEEVIVNRIINRLTCEKCGAGYNTISLKPKVDGICDVCGSPLYKRADDTVETVTKRLNVYNDRTKPLIDYYTELGKIIEIDSNQTPEKIQKDIFSMLEEK